MAETILVGDIGGTNVRFMLARALNGSIETFGELWRAPTNDYPSFNEAVARFLDMGQTPDNLPMPASAVFALAGPVDGDVVELTNKAWTIKRSELKKEFGFNQVHLMNDFAAMARSIPELPKSSLQTLQLGRPISGAPISICGAGTGLGQALLVPMSGDWKVIPGEGGHQSYAPQTEFEFEVLSLMQKRYGHISVELICSGQGLPKVYGAICEMAGHKGQHNTDPKTVTDLAGKGNQAAIRTCTLAAHALMGFSGDAVLGSGAWSGAVIAGGVSVHLEPFLTAPEALSRFNNKGIMQDRMRNVPLSLLTDTRAPLLGAAAFSRLNT